MPACWTLHNSEVCFVHLGKYGDLMIMLPAFKLVAEQMGKPPICIVSKEYASLFDGVSYVRPWVEPLHWWKGVKQARMLAEKRGFNPIIVKWWDEPEAKPPGNPKPGKKISLTVHGQKRIINAEEWDSYQLSQWRYAGFDVEQMMLAPLVFDRRCEYREAELRSRWFRTNKPKLLINFSTSGTSPFKNYMRAYGLVHISGCEIVNLGAIRAHRIYDLLGLYDQAAGLITTDTATLHLAAASRIPYIAFVNNGGAGSVPKGNCVLAVRYSDFDRKLPFYIDAVKNLVKKGAA